MRRSNSSGLGKDSPAPELVAAAIVNNRTLNRIQLVTVTRNYCLVRRVLYYIKFQIRNENVILRVMIKEVFD